MRHAWADCGAVAPPRRQQRAAHLGHAQVLAFRYLCRGSGCFILAEHSLAGAQTSGGVCVRHVAKCFVGRIANIGIWVPQFLGMFALLVCLLGYLQISIEPYLFLFLCIAADADAHTNISALNSVTTFPMYIFMVSHLAIRATNGASI